MKRDILVICSLIVPVFLFNPTVIYFLNPQFDEISFIQLAGTLGLINLLLISMLVLFLKLIPAGHARVVTIVLLSIATVAYFQAQVLSPLIELDFSGETIDWRGLGHWPRIELLVLLAAFVIAIFLIRSLFELRHWVAGLLLVGALLSAGLEIRSGAETYAVLDHQQAAVVDESVFEFSSSQNIIHLMPDAVQADIAAAILRKDDELARMLSGFIFFEANLGGFHSTAPTLPSVFTAELYNLSSGYQAVDVRRVMQERSFTRVLAEEGVQLDFAMASPLVCLGKDARCVHLPFADFRSRGYTTGARDVLVDFGLLADLSLFRQGPIYLKRFLYKGGSWRISQWATDPLTYYQHAPVLAEWSRHGLVADARPRYKWYHWIGAHAPQMWNAECEHIGHQPWDNQSVTEQTKCVLLKIGQFVEALRDLGIYDQTLIVIGSDHGTNQQPGDLRNYSHTELFRPGEVGTSRPLLMVKPLGGNGDLEFSLAPTSIIDIAATILDQIKLVHDYPGESVLNLRSDQSRARSYHRYAKLPFRWGPDPVALDKWTINGDVRNWDDWLPRVIHVDGAGSAQIDSMDDAARDGFVKGVEVSARLSPGEVSVIGRDLVMIMRPESDESLELELELKVPQVKRTQRVALTVNGQNSGLYERLKSANFERWKSVRFCVPPELVMRNRDNLFHLRFSETTPLEGMDHISVSALIRRARLSESEYCRDHEIEGLSSGL